MIDAEVIIVGTGVAGALAAYRLAMSGVRVLMLEGGPDVSRAELRERFLKTRTYGPGAVDPVSAYAPSTDPDDPDAYFTNVGTARYNVHLNKVVGGNTWHWTANCRRLGENEFRLKSVYDVGVDWPITYSDLEPYYTQAEHEMGVSAPSTDAAARRRSVPAPMADFEWPYMYKHLREVLSPHGIDLVAGSYARNSRDYDGRPACQGNNTCWPLCPIGAQYSAIVHVDKARALGVEVRAQSLVISLETDQSRRISAVTYRRPDGTHESASAKFFLIAASGMETPKILLASTDETSPAGLANSSGQVGRNFMDHVSVLTNVVTRDAVFPGRGPIAFGTIEGGTDGDYRRNRAASNLNIDNRMSVDVIAGDLLREGLAGDALEDELRYRAMRSFSIYSQVEILPEAGGRITLDRKRRDSAGQPRMRVKLDLDDYVLRGVEFAAEQHLELMDIIGVTRYQTFKAEYFGQHPSGATRMGGDPRTSVVDSQCRSHDHSNLFVASSSVFPTLGGANGPTLTIAALALRAADTILESLTRH